MQLPGRGRRYMAKPAQSSWAGNFRPTSLPLPIPEHREPLTAEKSILVQDIGDSLCPYTSPLQGFGLGKRLLE